MAAEVVLEGLHPLKHALRFGARVRRAVAPDPARVVALARQLAPDVADAIAALVERGEARVPFDVVAWAIRPPERALGDGLVVLLDGPRHLGNVGAAIRVAAAAGAGGVLVRGDADPWHPVAVRGAAGLQFALPVARVAEPPRGRPLVALDPAGAALGDVPPDAVLAFGAERRGLSAEIRERADALVGLPMRPGVSSLNLATAVAAVLYSLRAGRRGS
jgi:TrmH family RNA methyltransferase